MAAKTTYYVIGIATLLYFLTMKKSKASAAVTLENKIRGCDPYGCGHFGASRGNRKHNGVDLVIMPGEKVFSPISGKVTRIAYPYASDLSYRGLEIVNGEYTIKLFYIDPLPGIVGKTVTAGQQVAIAQNISAKYDPSMTNHVHFEIYDAKGRLLDATDFLAPVTLNRNLVLKKGIYNSAEVATLQSRIGASVDGDFGQLTENKLMAVKGVKQITLNQL